MTSKMDAILQLDRTPPPFLDIPIVDCGAFDAALLPGGRVIWHIPLECASAAASFAAYGHLAIVTDDMTEFNRRVAEEAGLL